MYQNVLRFKKNEEFIFVIGKNMDLLSKKYGHELQQKILSNEYDNQVEYDILFSKNDSSNIYKEEPFFETLVSEFNKKVIINILLENFINRSISIIFYFNRPLVKNII